jgi:FkbM family methyltransferase
MFFSGRPTSFQCQKTLQRLLGGPQLTSVTYTGGPLEGCCFECWTSEKYFLMGGTYETEVLDRLRGVVGAGAVVYDIGAHAGYWALMFGRLCSPGGRVIAFEPSPSNFARLERNLSHVSSSGVTAVNRAAADHDGAAFLAERGSESRMVDEAETPVGHSPITTVRLDTYVYGEGGPAPTFAKIDIEGAAGSCLGGMHAILDRERPHLLIEIHDDTEARAVTGILSDHEYRTERLEEGGRYPWHFQAIPATRSDLPV